VSNLSLVRKYFYIKGISMEFDFNEIVLIQNGEIMKQKIHEVITVLHEKGFQAKINSHGFRDMIYKNNILHFNLSVSIPVHDK
jgi:hypothetical protein